MSGIFGGVQYVGQLKPNYTGLQLQTAASNVALPIAWGLNRLAPNLIWFGDFTAVKHTTKQGGKGGPKIKSVSYTYTCSLQMALAEGVISTVTRSWRNNEENPGYTSLGFTLIDGSDPQSPWSYLVTAHPEAALNYNGVAQLVAANYDLGEQASLPNHNFECRFREYNTQVGGAGDADPAVIIDQFLTNSRFGASFPGASIDYNSLYSGPDAPTTGDAALQTYCQAIGFGMSPVLVDQDDANNTIDRWCKILNTAPVWSGSQLKFIPYGDEDITGNGVTYKPNMTPAYDLSGDDFHAENNEDPVKITRSDQADAWNVVRVEVADRTNNYAIKPCEAKDQASIEKFGLRQDQTFKAPEICVVEMGQKVAYLMLQRKVYVRNQYRFKLSWEYCRLEAMDIVTLTRPAIGLNLYPVRITNVEEDDDGFLTITAEDLNAGVSSTATYPAQGGEGSPVNQAVDPGPVNDPIFYEPFGALTNGVPSVLCGLSGGDGTTENTNWGGCQVWVSTNGTDYSQIGTVTNPARMGELTASLGDYMGANPDTMNTLSVTLAQSGGELESTDALNAETGVTLCLVNDELLSYEDSTLTGVFEYDLDTLYRGLYGTEPAAAMTGDKFLRIDDSVFRYALLENYIGTLLYFKFPSFNIYGNALQSLADCVEYQYTPNGNGFNVAPPDNVTITPTSTTSGGNTILSLVIDWDASPDGLVTSYNVRYRIVGDPDWINTSVGGGATIVSVNPIAPDETYEAEVQAVRTSGVAAVSAWVAATPTGSGNLPVTVSYVTPTTGFSITPSDITTKLILTPAGTLATGTINMPVNPVDTQVLAVASTETVTTLTVAPSGGQALHNAPTTLPAGTGFAMIYRGSNDDWYRLY